MGREERVGGSQVASPHWMGTNPRRTCPSLWIVSGLRSLLTASASHHCEDSSLVSPPWLPLPSSPWLPLPSPHWLLLPSPHRLLCTGRTWCGWMGWMRFSRVRIPRARMPRLLDWMGWMGFSCVGRPCSVEGVREVGARCRPSAVEGDRVVGSELEGLERPEANGPRGQVDR